MIIKSKSIYSKANNKKTKKTIALIANSAWYIANFRMSLIRSLELEGYNVIVITPIDDFINTIYEVNSIKYIPIKHLSRKGVNPITDWKLYREFLNIYKREKPDVVLHYTIKPNLYGTFAAKRLGIKSIVVIPGLGYTFTKEGLIKRIVQKAYRYILPYNQKVLFENKSDSDYFIANKILESDKTIALKGCGTDLDYFKFLEKNKNGNTRKFLFMGRLIREKGILEFIEAAKITYKKYPNARFWIIGHIDAENPSAIPNEVFLKWINHPAIKYLGFIRDVRQTIRNVDCVVLPSYYPEGVPRVLQEGMAMNKPIITADSIGCKEAVDDGINGFLVRPKDHNDLASAFEKICLFSEKEINEMGAKGRKKAEEEFDEKISTRIYLDVIKSCFE